MLQVVVRLSKWLEWQVQHTGADEGDWHKRAVLMMGQLLLVLLKPAWGHVGNEAIVSFILSRLCIGCCMWPQLYDLSQPETTVTAMLADTRRLAPQV